MQNCCRAMGTFMPRTTGIFQIFLLIALHPLPFCKRSTQYGSQRNTRSRCQDWTWASEKHPSLEALLNEQDIEIVFVDYCAVFFRSTSETFARAASSAYQRYILLSNRWASTLTGWISIGNGGHKSKHWWISADAEMQLRSWANQQRISAKRSKGL